MSYNNISNLGAKSISEVLKTNTKLKELRIQGNKISGDGLEELFKALRRSCLKILDLS